MGIFTSEVGGILSEIVSLHVLSAFGSSIFALLVSHALLKSLLFHFKLLDLSLLLVLLFCQHGCLRFENAKFVVSWSVDLELFVEHHALFLHSLDIVCEPLEFILGCHWLLKKKFDSLESFSLVIEFSTQDLVLEISVFSSVSSQIIKKLVWSEMLVRDLFDIEESLFDGQNILFIELNHIGQFPLLLIKLGILLLLFSKFGGCLEESMKIFLITLVFEKVDLGEQLLFFLLQLVDFFLKFAWIHAFRSHMINILMGSLELCLKILVHLESFSHLLVTQELIRNFKWH